MSVQFEKSTASTLAYFEDLQGLNDCLETCIRKQDKSPLMDRVVANSRFHNPPSVSSIFIWTLQSSKNKNLSELTRLSSNISTLIDRNIYKIKKSEEETFKGFLRDLFKEINSQKESTPGAGRAARDEKVSKRCNLTKLSFLRNGPVHAVKELALPVESPRLKKTYQTILSWLQFEADFFDLGKKRVHYFRECKSYEGEMETLLLSNDSIDEIALFISSERFIHDIKFEELRDDENFNVEKAKKILVLHDSLEQAALTFPQDTVSFCKAQSKLLGLTASNGRFNIFLIRHHDLVDLMISFYKKNKRVPNPFLQRLIDHGVGNERAWDQTPPFLREVDLEICPKVLTKISPFIQQFFESLSCMDQGVGGEDFDESFCSILSFWVNAYYSDDAVRLRRELYEHIYALLKGLKDKQYPDLSALQSNQFLKPTLSQEVELDTTLPLEYIQRMIEKRKPIPKPPSSSSTDQTTVDRVPSPIDNEPARPVETKPKEKLKTEAVAVFPKEDLFFTYHPRVARWFTCDPYGSIDPLIFPEYVDHTNFRKMVVIHGFSPVVDSLWKKYGIKTKWEKNDLYSLPVQLGDTRGIISLCVDSKTNVCYHRCFRQRTDDQLLNDLVEERFNFADFPPLSSSDKKLPNISLVDIQNQDAVEVSTYKITIFDRRLSLPITIFAFSPDTP